MKSVLLGVVAGALVGSINGCRDPIKVFGTPGLIHVQRLEAPATVAPGQDISLVLTLERGYCDRFERFEIGRTTSSATITALGRHNVFENATCPDIPVIEQHTIVLEGPFQDAYDVMVNRPREGPLTARVEIE